MRKRGSALGSSSSTDPELVVVGRLGRPSGLEGYLGLYVDEGDLVHFSPGSSVHIAGNLYTVRATRRGNKGPQVAFDEIVDRAAAESIRGNDVHVTSRRALTEGEFWPDDLIGLSVRPGGGEVVAVSHGPAQDRLVIERGGSRFEVPFVADLVPKVDLAAGFVEVVEVEGLSQP